MARLTKKNNSQKKSKKLVNDSERSQATKLTKNAIHGLDVPFEISMRGSLDPGYSFYKLSGKGIKAFHKFVEETVGRGLTWKEVNSLKLRTKGGITQKTIFHGDTRNMYHYEMVEAGRVFGYRDGNDFIVCRIDPGHKFHKTS